MTNKEKITVATLIEEAKKTPEYLVDSNIFHIIAEQQNPVITKEKLLNLITKK